jgi:hypothetical protein
MNDDQKDYIDQTAKRCARLAGMVKEQLGEGWTKLPGLAGEEKGFEFLKDEVILKAGRYRFLDVDDDLVCLQERGSHLLIGDWRRGKLEWFSVLPLVDPNMQ